VVCVSAAPLFSICSCIFPAVEYHGLTADIEREIFQRVQLGVSLTAAGAEFV